MQAPNRNGPGKEHILATNAVSPAQEEKSKQNQPPQDERQTGGKNWQGQIAEMMQPAIASIQQEVTQAAEQQLEPLRSRIQQLAEQQLAGPVSDQSASPLRSLVQTPSQQAQAGESALQRWGETLDGVALIVLALGEVLEGLALLLQALGLVVGGKSSAQPEQEPEASSEEGPEGDASSQEEEGEPSLVHKVGDAVSGGASSLKRTVSHVVGGSSSQQGQGGGPAPLQQWGSVLQHAASLMQALGDASSSKHGQEGGLSALARWGPIMKQATSLVQELNQVLNDGSASQHGQDGLSTLQRWGGVVERAAAAIQALGDGSSQKQEDGKSSQQERKRDSSSKEEQGDESSSQQEGDKGSSPLEALFGESSPLQTLREFSKRQQGPGGLAPKGPIGRKPPPGPLRRDRLPDARSQAR